jgi:hypothetical protein
MTPRIARPGQADVARTVAFALQPIAGKRWRVTVVVHPTRAALQRWCRAAGYRTSRRTDGLYQGLRRRYRSGRPTPDVGEVHLHRGSLSMRVVTHEMFHATVDLGRRLRFDFTRLDAADSVNDDEELLAYAHGELCRQFMVHAERHGIYQ